MLKRTPLERRSRPNPMSAKKIGQINAEYDDRIKLCLRCGGNPVTKTRWIRLNNGERCHLKTVTCIGGFCEICGKPAYPNQNLHPHERKPRSSGGRLSLENSVMCHDHPCHSIEQNNNVKWSRNDV